MYHKHVNNLTPTSNHWQVISLLLIVIAGFAFAHSALAQQTEKTTTSNNSTKAKGEKKTKEQKPKADKKNEQTPASSSATKDIRSTIEFPINSAQQQRQDLQHFEASAHLQTLLVEQDDFIIYFHQQNTPYSKGVAILVPDWQQSALEPRAIGSLAKFLPDQGWTVIAIQPPAKPEDYPVASRDESIAAEQNQALIEQYQQKLNAMMNKVMERAAQYPGIFLLIAQGQNSANLLNLYQKNAIKQPSAVVLLSSFVQDSANQQRFIEQIATSRLPILDLLLQHENPMVQAQAKLRQQQVARQLKQQYRQRQINSIDLTGYYPEQNTYRIINGWLKSLGW